MEIKRTFTVHRPVDRVWDVLGNDFAGAHKWGSGLYHSEGYGTPRLEGAACSNRACETKLGSIKEAIRTFDPEHYVLEYEVIEGFPGFVKSGINKWTLTPRGDETRVDVHFRAETQGLLGRVMAPVMGWQMNKTFDQVLGDFTYYVENGRPSPHKRREIEKRAAKAA